MNNSVTTTRRATSSATRELLKARALERGLARSIELRMRVRMMMKTIEAEIAANDGKYPGKTALSAAEVARRSDVHPTTFYSFNQRELGEEVNDWLKELKTGGKTEKKAPARRDLQTRIADWATLYEGLAQSHRDTELELQETQRTLALATTRIRELEAEVAKSSAEVQSAATAKVVRIGSRELD